MLYQLAYMSATSHAWNRADLIDLLRHARAKNQRLGITGILLHRHSGFLQLLEGAQTDVERVYSDIRADDRHHDVVMIWDHDGGSRWFADWFLAFRDLEEDPVTEPGLTDILRGPVDASTFSQEAVIQLWGLLRPPGPRPAEHRDRFRPDAV